jgi:peptide/nickel transport system substrate-binding protein
MRRLLIGLAVALVAFGVVAVAQTNVPETPGATPGGTLTLGVGQVFQNLDPRIMNSAYDAYVVGEVFDRLVDFHPDTKEIVPFVAKSWEVISDEQTRFFLNENVYFHNGDKLTAEDVAFTFNWIADEANNSPNATELVWMKEAVVVEEFVVDIFTKPDYAPYAPGFASETRAIVPKAYIEEVGDEAFNVAPVGSGPYKFVEWRTGDRIILERNEDYWLVYPNLDQVVYRPIPELSVMMAELEAGGIDITDTMPATDVPRFRAMEGIDVMQSPGMFYFYVYFNMQHLPSSDIRWRKAVYHSVNYDAAVFSIFQNLTGLRQYGSIPGGLWANDTEYLRDEVALQEDDAEAKRLFGELKAEGIIPDDYKTRIYCPMDPRRRQLATIMATNLIENGIDAEVVPMDWATYLPFIDRSESDPTALDLDQGIIGWSGGYDPNDFAYYMFHSDNATVGAANNVAWYSDAEVDQWLFEAATTLDQAEREAKYVAAQRKALESYCHIPGYNYIQTNGVSTRVKGFIVDPLGGYYLCDPYHNVWVEG